MEVRNCRNCGRLYNYMGGGYLICSLCKDELDKKFAEVKKYIREEHIDAFGPLKGSSIILNQWYLVI